MGANEYHLIAVLLVSLVAIIGFFGQRDRVTAYSIQVFYYGFSFSR
jgi:hypothetical protein